MNDTYNGWTNRETWLFNLWFADSWDDDTIGEYIEGCDDRESATEKLKNALSSWFDEVIEEANIPNWVSDFCDFSAIDWQEIAENMLSDFDF